MVAIRFWRETAGQKLKDFWIDMLNGKKNTYEMCAKCCLPSFDCNDNIDDFAPAILARVK